MIGEHALYRKIQVVLDIAKKGKTSSIQDLSDKVFSNNLINFIYKHFDKDTEEEVSRQSIPSIKKTISVCIDLGLIHENGHLTTSGIKAVNPNYFNDVLSKQIIKFLEEYDVTVNKIEKQVKIMLHSSHPILPTAKALWESLTPDISLNTFSIMFTLLAHCERLVAFRKKIYLGFQK